MPARSEYVIECVCGTVNRSHEAGTICTNCGRELVVENWGKTPAKAGAR
jgi:hypothetical protein